MKYTLNDLIYSKGITEIVQQAVMALLHENEELRAKLKELENQKPVASIYIDGTGEREFDDWKCDLPIGRSLLYLTPGAKGE